MINSLIWPVIVLGGLAVFFGIVLAYASKKFAVETDERVVEVRGVLPGANCGGCGYAGCDALADAIVKGAAPLNACPVGGAELAKKVAEIMGQVAEEKEKEVARVICNGDCNSAKEKYEFFGIEDCKAAAMMVGGGQKQCAQGCLGLGTCVRVCPFDAIHVVNGVAIVDEEKCTACKKCIVACPKNVIELIPVSKEVRVLCNNTEKGKATMDACKVGCIACQKCVKACKFDAIHVNNNLAKIDYDKCVNCMMCVEVCPTNAIYGNFANRKKAKINEETCIGCTICKKNCNFDAIEGDVKVKHKILEDKCVGCGQCVSKCPKNSIKLH